ncbi:hypothetical protein GQ42DRAFT_165177 [Ramicandelaber brevisporus]|nr:hypothetical protein GQ42DRAFT_165177 [Ramicandelaber brevisporus]
MGPEPVDQTATVATVPSEELLDQDDVVYDDRSSMDEDSSSDIYDDDQLDVDEDDLEVTSTGSSSSQQHHQQQQQQLPPSQTITVDAPTSLDRMRLAAKARPLATIKLGQQVCKVLRERSCYELMPVSGRVVVLDSTLPIVRGLHVLTQNGIDSAPLWAHDIGEYAGMLTDSAVVALIERQLHVAAAESHELLVKRTLASKTTPSSKQAVSNNSSLESMDNDSDEEGSSGLPAHNPNAIAAKAMSDLANTRITEMKSLLGFVRGRQLCDASVSVHQNLYVTARKMCIEKSCRSITVVDRDHSTGNDALLTVLSQYTLLKFIAMNVASLGISTDSSGNGGKLNYDVLKQPLRSLGIGTYRDLRHVYGSTPVVDAISIMVRFGVSCLPVLDESTYMVENLIDETDIATLILTLYGEPDEPQPRIIWQRTPQEEWLADKPHLLSMTVAEMIKRRPDTYQGVVICKETDSLLALFDAVCRVYLLRMVIVDDFHRLVGIVTVSDVLSMLMDCWD